MSANKIATSFENHDRVVYSFELDKPIPSYLLAIAAGNLTEK